MSKKGNFPEPEVASKICWFYVTTDLKPKDEQFIVLYD